MYGRTYNEKSDLKKAAARMPTDKRSQQQIKNGYILLTMIGILSLGHTEFDYVNEFHTDVYSEVSEGNNRSGKGNDL